MWKAGAIFAGAWQFVVGIGMSFQLVKLLSLGLPNPAADGFFSLGFTVMVIAYTSSGIVLLYGATKCNQTLTEVHLALSVVSIAFHLVPFGYFIWII